MIVCPFSISVFFGIFILMKPIFAKAPPLGVRLFLAIIASLALIASDGRSSVMIQVRNMLETAVSGLYYFANTPRSLLDGVSNNFIDNHKLLIENRVLKEQLREKNAELQLLSQFKVENQRLRLLLGSPLRQDEYKKVAEVLTAEMDVYRQQVIINQGESDGAFVGQPIIDERGVVGQVISVGEKSSRVLLISDVTHAIPVQVLRNDVRAIANGTGHSDELILDNLPRNVDIKVGDLLVTSGLGGRFPEGYPVAIVETVSNDGKNHFARVTARPEAQLERLRYLLQVWPHGDESRRLKSISPQDVRDAVEERRRTINPLDKLKNNRKTQVSTEDSTKSELNDDDVEYLSAPPPEQESGTDHSVEEGSE